MSPLCVSSDTAYSKYLLLGPIAAISHSLPKPGTIYFPSRQRVLHPLARFVSNYLQNQTHSSSHPTRQPSRRPKTGRPPTRTCQLIRLDQERGVVGGHLQSESTYAPVAASKANHRLQPPSLPLSRPDWRQNMDQMGRHLPACCRDPFAGLLTRVPCCVSVSQPFPTKCAGGDRACPWVNGSPEQAESDCALVSGLENGAMFRKMETPLQRHRTH